GRALPTELHGQTGFALARDAKVPKPPFERPWDRLVPAKSVRKLTARSGLSKKFLRPRPVDVQRIRLLDSVSSVLPRRRESTKNMMIKITNMASPIPMFIGVSSPGAGVGLEVGVGGGAFFAANMAWAY